MSRYPKFDRKDLILKPAVDRRNRTTRRNPSPNYTPNSEIDAALKPLIAAIRRARSNDRPVIVAMGAHLIKLGLREWLSDMIRGKWITHVAMNGAALIHDYELAIQDGTSEDVGESLADGTFGLWKDTGVLNRYVVACLVSNEGLGTAVGSHMCISRPIDRDCITTTGYINKVPVTVHVTMGADTVHMHPTCTGKAWGHGSYNDFLIFAQAITQLEGGVFLNIGSAVMGPEIFQKALTMARNVAHRKGETINEFTTAVFDIAPLPHNWRDAELVEAEPLYYYRPWKTILRRAVANGGQSHYIMGDLSNTIPALCHPFVG